MKLAERQTYSLPNYGIPHENNLNLIGMILSSRRISHTISTNIDIDPMVFANQIGNNDRDFVANIQDLWATADALSIKYAKVEASVMLLGKCYKIIFNCYSN